LLLRKKPSKRIDRIDIVNILDLTCMMRTPRRPSGGRRSFTPEQEEVLNFTIEDKAAFLKKE
jgi:hypothetical protein